MIRAKEGQKGTKMKNYIMPRYILGMAHDTMSVLNDIRGALAALEDRLFENLECEETVEHIAFLKVKDDVEKASDLVHNIRLHVTPCDDPIAKGEYDPECEALVLYTWEGEEEEDPNEIET